MKTLFLLAQVAGTEVAISSDAIESVVTVGDVVPVPRCDPVVAGLFALRSRVLTLVDCQYRVTGISCQPAPGALAAIAAVGGHSFGLLVEKVHDVVEVAPEAVVPAIRLGRGWSSMVSKLVEFQGRMIMVVDPVLLVAVEDDRAVA